MAARSEKEVMEQLFDEMESGVIKNYDEMQKRKAELLNASKGKNNVLPKGQVNTSSGVFSKIIIFAIILVSIVFLIDVFGLRGAVRQMGYNGLNANDDPMQSSPSVSEFTANYGGLDWKISPKADYKLVAKVQSKHHIPAKQDSTAAIGQYDLALSWGKLVDPKYDKYITYHQFGREYTVNYSADCPLSASYISEHSANTHIIAATDKVLEGIEDIKSDDIVYMEGFLVNVFRKGEKEGYLWTTSLARNDNSSYGGCEVFYVQKLQIGSKLYE